MLAVVHVWPGVYGIPDLLHFFHTEHSIQESVFILIVINFPFLYIFSSWLTAPFVGKI